MSPRGLALLGFLFSFFWRVCVCVYPREWVEMYFPHLLLLLAVSFFTKREFLEVVFLDSTPVQFVTRAFYKDEYFSH